jgi:hypothetical protein
VSNPRRDSPDLFDPIAFGPRPADRELPAPRRDRHTGDAPVESGNVAIRAISQNVSQDIDMFVVRLAVPLGSR